MKFSTDVSNQYALLREGALHAGLRIRDVYPGSEYFPSRIQGLKDSRIRIRIKEFKYIKPKKLSEI